MPASKRTRTVDHHEWPLTSPAHITDISAAVAAAEREIQKLDRPTDIWITSGDDEVVVGYTTVGTTKQRPTDRASAAEKQPAAQPAPKPLFQAGHVYLSANSYFRFTCQRVVDGIAIGVQEALRPGPWNSREQTWYSVMDPDCWTDLDGSEGCGRDCSEGHTYTGRCEAGSDPSES